MEKKVLIRRKTAPDMESIFVFFRGVAPTLATPPPFSGAHAHILGLHVISCYNCVLNMLLCILYIIVLLYAALT